MTRKVRSEESPGYGQAAVLAKQGMQAFSDDEVIEEALKRLSSLLAMHSLQSNDCMNGPKKVSEFLRLHLAADLDEYFCILYLDNRHTMIQFERLFHGTIDGASVYPRVVVRRALEMNANAVILAHNHPSGNPEPSVADQAITRRLRDALSLVDIRVLDHVIVGRDQTLSFAEAGLI